MKKLAIFSLAAVLICGLAVPQVAFAEETQDEEIETSVTIRGLPKEMKAGEGGTFTVTVTGEAEELDGAYLEICESGEKCVLSVDGAELTEEGKVKVSNLVSGTPITVDFTIQDWAEGSISMQAELCDEEGYWLESAEEELTCISMLTASMVFEPTTKVVAGVAYPYSVTITNRSDKAIENLKMQVYASWHIKKWSATVTGDTQDGVSFADGWFTIASIQPGENVTLSGTITLPTAAVGESTHVIATVFSGENIMASAGSEDDATGDADYYFKVVASENDVVTDDSSDNTSDNAKADAGETENNTISTNVKAKAAKTADTTPVAGLMAVMIMAMGMIAISKARRVK